MSERDEQLIQLITKYLQQVLTQDERMVLDAWLDERPENRVFLQSLTDEETLQEKLLAFHAINRQRLRALIQTKLADRGQVPKQYRNRIFKWLQYAAAIIIALACVWYINTILTEDLRSKTATQKSKDIPPGGNRATLTMADGRVVDLSEAQTGIIIGDGITYADGSAVLSPEVGKSERQEVSIRNTQYATLTTPKGGTYQITLPDGTKVWLNAASKLEYPSRFTGDERVVKLEGEAYFEVSEQVSKSQPHKLTDSQVHSLTRSQKVPFRVVSKGQVVEVLGTEFNISAYDDDQETRTTLVEGAVEISNLTTKTVRKLSPGQQSCIGKDDIRVLAVDIATATAWKNGVFYFKRTPAAEVMKQIERWYNVDITYKTDIPHETFSGEIGRDVSLQTIMEFLQLSGIRFHLANRELIIE